MKTEWEYAYNEGWRDGVKAEREKHKQDIESLKQRVIQIVSAQKNSYNGSQIDPIVAELKNALSYKIS